MTVAGITITNPDRVVIPELGCAGTLDTLADDNGTIKVGDLNLVSGVDRAVALVTDATGALGPEARDHDQSVLAEVVVRVRPTGVVPVARRVVEVEAHDDHMSFLGTQTDSR